ncbi:MAG: polymorphic toxin-type HINT domain-containing protein [Prochloraceae cyanobacterium]|nr:polymorphic toxin-type HINT domain-containing protein [Prochloraceae cyanobacterium]
MGRVLKITGPLGEETQMVYNSLGQVLSETTPETGTTKYTYDDNGKLDSRIDAKGQKVSFEYDNLGRVTKKKVYDRQTDANPAKTVTYLYDDPALVNTKGRLTKIIMPEGIYGFQYNNLGQVEQETVELEIEGAQKTSFVTRYTYDAAGRPDTIIYPDGSIVRYSYDYQGEVYTIELKEVGESDFTTYATYENYTALGNLGKVSYNNGVNSEYEYDEIGRIKKSKTQKGGDSYLDFTYEWNKANKLLKIDDRTDKELTEKFKYDIVGRLIDATGSYPAITYDYDRAGNITKRNEQEFKYQPDKKHQFADARYDANGNTTRYSSWDYTYDAEDRLLKVNKYDNDSGDNDSDDDDENDRLTVNKFTYDDSGDRLTKTEADGTKTYYVSPLYEVVRYSSDDVNKEDSDDDDSVESFEVHTKYIVGPQGVVAAISKNSRSDVSLLPEINYNTASLEADTYNPFSGGNLAKFVSAKATQLVYYRNLGSLLVAGTIVGWLLFVLLLWIYQFFRSASKESWAGIARRLLLQGLVQRGWISSDTAARLNTSTPPTWLTGAWYRPGSFALVLVAFSSINLTGGITLAQLTPGNNGAGYPIAGTTLYFHYGHLGSTNLVTDEEGEDVSLVYYEPYGEVADSSEGQDNFRAKFTGKEYDSNSELYYFGSRYYEAHLGRFITPDPARQYFSPYIYGNGDPLSTIDPNGEVAFAVAVLAGALVGAYVGGVVTNGGFDDGYNPASWDWSSGKTYAGIAGGAAIGAVAAGAAATAPALIASLGMSSVATSLATMATMGVIGGGVNGSYTAMGGGDVGEIATAFGIGFAAGALFAAPLVGVRLFVAYFAMDTMMYLQNPSIGGGIQLGLDVVDRGTGGVGRKRRGGKSQTAGGCASFAAETEVLTNEGEKPVEEVAVGDLVWAYNEETGEEGMYPVSHLFTRIAPEVVLITAGEEVIEATTEHEFYVDSKGWVKAENLNVGDELVERGGNTVTVTALQSREDSTRVYNFEVDEAHTYYVSGEEVLVHNYNCDQAQAQQLRARLGDQNGDIGGTRRNIAIANFTYTNQNNQLMSYNIYAVSGPSSRYGGVAVPSQIRQGRRIEDRKFTTFSVLGHSRARDSEVYLLEHLRSQIEARNVPDVGVLTIYSELYYCASCGGVIEQFSKKYPNIGIDTYWGVNQYSHSIKGGLQGSGWVNLGVNRRHAPIP